MYNFTVNLDDASCYRALASRDRRFEGRFVVGVKTTGVYCRPGCPARLPKRQNANFYRCAAAAEEAGFRACRRCRPETAPGTPAWAGTSSTVSRALRLIGDGGLDGYGVDDLAERLGVGSRHLRRLFVRHLGAGPLAVARTRRAHFARRLIDETELPLSQIALGSGFQSIRAFNTTMRETFDASPRELRRSTHAASHGGTMVLRIPFRSPIDWTGLLEFLGRRAIEGVERVDQGRYERSFRATGCVGVLRVELARDARALELSVPDETGPNLIGVVENVARLFDLHADPLPIWSHLRRDPMLRASLGSARGVRVPGAYDRFEMVVRAVLGQQISVAGARTIAGRVAARYGVRLGTPSETGITHVFPAADQLATADLESVGLTRARADCLRAVAQRIADGRLVLDAGRGLGPWVDEFTELPGIGPWTAHYVAMRALGEPDAFPASDLGVRHALADGGALPRVQDVTKRAEAWRPWRAYAVMALWRRPQKQKKKRD